MLKKLLITGAAGGLGQIARAGLTDIAETLRLSDIAEMAPAGPNEEVVQCDLGDAAAVDALVEGCDGILHLGGISTENTFERILNANIVGLHNLYEAARKHGHPRIFFASSNHVVGFYRQDEWIDGSAAHKPDSWYGVSKSYGEAVALMYFHKFGQETAMVRIGSCFAEPADHRMLATWLAPEDFLSLCARVYEAPRLGCPVIYGVSDNDAKWWDNGAASYLGWRPKHSSAQFARKMAETVPLPETDDPVSMWQGGKFTSGPIIKE